MDAEVRPDPEAYRRHRTCAIVLAASLLGTIPIAWLAGRAIRLAIGPAALADAGWGPSLFLIGPAIGALAWAHDACWPALAHRCPQCRRRTEAVEPVGGGSPRPNILRHCPRCGVAWDLGWGPGEPA